MLYEGDTFQFEGHSFKVSMPYDDSGDTPWERGDMHGPVSDWTTRNKRPGEIVLCADRGSRRFYDFAAACKLARKEWGASCKVDAAACARRDFDYLQGWCNDRWSYVGVVVTLLDDDGDETDLTESLWGVESDDDSGIQEIAHECARMILATIVPRAPANLAALLAYASPAGMSDPIM